MKQSFYTNTVADIIGNNFSKANGKSVVVSREKIMQILLTEVLFYYFCKKAGSQMFDKVITYMFKADNRNTRTTCEICSKSTTIKTPE